MSVDQQIMGDRYLGDGVYASFDGNHIVLDLRGEDCHGQHTRISLDPEVMQMLKKYEADLDVRLKELKIQIDERSSE